MTVSRSGYDARRFYRKPPVSATQLITRTDGGYTRVGLDGLITYSGRPELGQFYEPIRERWAAVRLRRMDPAVCPTEALASACPVAEDDFRIFPHAFKIS